MKTEGIVIAVARGRCRVFADERELDCANREHVTVGDRVVAESDPWRIVEVLPRRTVLSRPDPHDPNQERLIAANLDLVVHVASVKSPPLRARLIDRFLIAAMRGGAAAAICVNKIDLLGADEQDELEPLRAYREMGVPVVVCSTHTRDGLDALRDLMRGKTCALVGHSGVGKSSILNALDERLHLATGELHKRGTGRHTTTASTLHDLGDDTYVIDTPGIREFGLWDIRPEELRAYFPEFAGAAELCRFNDCTHLHEPACEVKERVARGEIHPARYDAYVRLANDLSAR